MIATVLFATYIAPCSAQINNDEKIPEKVIKSFDEKFPNIIRVDWEIENEKEWEADFKLNNADYSANFTADGIWKKTEHKLNINQLPQVIKNSISKEFNDYIIESAELIENSEVNAYEVKIKNGEQTIEVLFDNSGKVIKKEKEESEEKED